jgi:hypothetical protein
MADSRCNLSVPKNGRMISPKLASTDGIYLVAHRRSNAIIFRADNCLTPCSARFLILTLNLDSCTPVAHLARDVAQPAQDDD